MLVRMPRFGRNKAFRKRGRLYSPMSACASVDPVLGNMCAKLKIELFMNENKVKTGGLLDA